MKLPTKGTLDSRAISPRGAIAPMTFDMFATIASKFKSRLPVYAKIITKKAISPKVNDLPDRLLKKCPAK